MKKIKNFLKKKKKGNMILFSLAVMLFIMCLAALFFNLTMGFEMGARAKKTASEVARVRAQAVDIPLKEQEGIVEVLHPPVGSAYNDPNDKHPEPEFGHKKILTPDDASYAEAFHKANKTAEEMGQSLLASQMGKNMSNQDTIKNPEFCFDFKPLPTTGQKITFECTFKSGNTIKKDLYVSSISENEVVVLTDDKGVERKNTIKNVVFVGMRYEYRYFFDKFFEQFGTPSTREGTAGVLAYPQLDKCFGALCK